MLPKVSLPTAIVTGMLILGTVSIFSYVLLQRQGPGSLTIKAGNSELVVDFEGGKLNFLEVIGTLLENEEYEKTTRAILRDSYGLYHKDSELLVDHFRRTPGDSKLAMMMRDLLIDLKGPFGRSYHTFYDITDTAAVDAIKALDYRHPVALAFRDMADNAEGIFENRAVDAVIDFAPESQLGNGNAAVCRNSRFRGRDLLLLNPENPSRSITVFSRDIFTCITVGPDDMSQTELIQINRNDAEKLFGSQNVEAKEPAILFPASRGYSLGPRLVGNT